MGRFQIMALGHGWFSDNGNFVRRWFPKCGPGQAVSPSPGTLGKRPILGSHPAMLYLELWAEGCDMHGGTATGFGTPKFEEYPARLSFLVW